MSSSSSWLLSARPCKTRDERGGFTRGSPSGPLDATAHAAANLAVGNDPRGAAIEIPLGPLRVRAVGNVTVSVDGEAPRDVHDGGELVVPVCERAVRYLAVRGGVDVPVVLGSRATLAVAGLGEGGRCARAMRSEWAPRRPLPRRAPFRR